MKDYFNSATQDLYSATGGTDALTKIVAITNTMANSDQFQTYVDNEATADFTGLVSAMQQINTNNPTLVSGEGLNVLEEGYSSNAVSDILTQIFSGD